ncbi:hypothetical protein LCGC14_0145830 [marine sediment metagenome]|uniref:Uncharacterized protein n=1 Tax=marine sediment metagenome TaxID=412755 RepID=A0A0F9VFB3_9ZZZZ
MAVKLALAFLLGATTYSIWVLLQKKIQYWRRLHERAMQIPKTLNRVRRDITKAVQ